ncbi:MarR family winged helix-turn-helix transcriptional regulator [Mangrovibacillus cuniculi]|uniref:MarR family transcriptional regulator n=1 Tax=Mangrovibacillus cuniculi TaxID=2593652 RepID=A0A7S8HED4_9BACI|nr:MarR family transcriptional regulator [Mangrovibacillus cuniculi]QPC45724.1 MarR family transcriptional regulator [Mangrovibacillus cuniculi]
MTVVNNSLLLEQQLCFRLYTASREITKFYRPLLEKLNLTYPQYLVMLYLWETNTGSVKDIGERLHLDSGTLTPMLKRMEQRNLLTRERSKTDERTVIVKITQEGTTLKEKAQEVPVKIFEKLNVGKEEYLQMLNLLDTVLEQFTKADLEGKGE